MQLQKRSGMTLAEVIISLIILSVVVVSILGFFSQGYLSTVQARAGNEENYKVQTYFEEQMAEAKKNGAGGNETIPFNFEVKNGRSGSIDVMGKTLSYSNSAIRLFLSNQKEATLELPDNLSAIIEGAAPYYYVGGRIPSGKAELESDAIDKIKTDMEEAWFLSHRKVGEQGVVPVGNLITNKDSSATTQMVRPVMSNTTRDVTVIKKSNTGFIVTDKMRGKYLTFGARVYSTFGRVGQYHVAEPIWIMGIPVLDGLSVHTDADLATTVDGGAIGTTDQPTANGLGTIVRNYRDSNLSTSQYNDVPVWNVYETDLKQTRQFIALQGGGTWFPNRNLTRGETVSMLIGNKKQSGPLVSFELGTGASNAWQPTLRWSLNLAEDGRMTTTVDDPSNLNLAIGFKDVGQEALDYSKDHSVQIRTTKVSGEWAILVEVFIDGQSVHSEKVLYRGVTSGNVVEHNHENARLVFGGKTYINELAIYTKALRDSEMDTLATYFKGKYDTTYNANQP